MDFSALGKEPISAEQPAGCDVRYEPLFDQLQGEIDRSTLPALAGAVDWEKVVNLSAELLSSKSKDLLVAGYLAVGLVHTRRLDGLSVALKIYRDLLEYHAAGLFPQRERGRLRSVEWWVDKSVAALGALNGEAGDSAQLSVMQDHLERIGESLAGMLADPPSLKVLQELLQRMRPAGDQPPPRPIAQLAPSPSSADHEPGDHLLPQRPSTLTPLDSDEAVEQSLRRLRETAAVLREQEIANPLAYRLTRQAAWLTVWELPQATAGRTLIAPPSALLVNRLADLKRVGDRSTLLKELEAQLGQFIFWLDLNRMAAEALEQVGASPAAHAVGQETAFLLQRLPGLAELSFADGTPFAEPGTLRWLAKFLPGKEGGRAAPTAPAPGDPQPESLIGSEVEVADSLISEGKLIEAIDRLQERLKNCSSERERIQWRLALSRVLMNAEQTRFALPHLEQVVSDIDTYRLESYDPAIALEASKLAWHGFDSQAEPHFKALAQETLHRIARIDLAEMVRLAGE